MPALSAPTVSAPAAPQANPLFVKPGESILDYESRLGSTPGVSGSGMGFGTPQPIAQPLVDQSTGATPAAPATPGTPATTPAPAPTSGSGLSANDAAAVALGYQSYADAVSQLTAPSDDTTQFYNSAYSAAGLDTLNNQIVQKQNDLNTATGNINDNPWLDEASRVGRVKNLTTLATADIKNLQNEYNTKLKGVQDLVTQHSKDLSATAASNKAKLSFLEAQAKAVATQTAATTKADNAAPKTIKGANGATFQWDPKTGVFTQILPGKTPTTTGGGKTPVPAASPTGTGSQFANFNFTAKQLGTLNASGLNQSDANGILTDIKNGQTLQNIRQQMTASGLNPGLLDTIMFYVDPAHNTPAAKTKAPAAPTGPIPGISLAAPTPSFA